MRAKMRVVQVTDTGTSDLVKFGAVTGNSANPEDNTYAKYTPSAVLDMQIDNPSLKGTIKPGQMFYLDFTQTE